jgi:hypothetical protein
MQTQCYALVLSTDLVSQEATLLSSSTLSTTPAPASEIAPAPPPLRSATGKTFTAVLLEASESGSESELGVSGPSGASGPASRSSHFHAETQDETHDHQWHEEDEDIPESEAVCVLDPAPLVGRDLGLVIRRETVHLEGIVDARRKV